MKWSLAALVVAAALLWAWHVERVAEDEAMAFCDGIQVGSPLDDVAARAREAGDERLRRIGPDSITVGFTGIPPFSRHLCAARAEKGMVVAARYVYLD